MVGTELVVEVEEVDETEVVVGTELVVAPVVLVAVPVVLVPAVVVPVLALVVVVAGLTVVVGALVVVVAGALVVVVAGLWHPGVFWLPPPRSHDIPGVAVAGPANPQPASAMATATTNARPTARRKEPIRLIHATFEPHPAFLTQRPLSPELCPSFLRRSDRSLRRPLYTAKMGMSIIY